MDGVHCWQFPCGSESCSIYQTMLMSSDFKGLLDSQGHQWLLCSYGILIAHSSAAAASPRTCVLFPPKWAIPILNLTFLQPDRITAQERCFSNASGFLHRAMPVWDVPCGCAWELRTYGSPVTATVPLQISEGLNSQKTPSRGFLGNISR